MLRLLIGFSSPRLKNAVQDRNGEGRWNAEEFARIARESRLDRGQADIQVVRSDLCFASLLEDTDEPRRQFEGGGGSIGRRVFPSLSCAFERAESLSRLGESLLDCEKWIAFLFLVGSSV
jgi:hypothetical protein